MQAKIAYTEAGDQFTTEFTSLNKVNEALYRIHVQELKLPKEYHGSYAKTDVIIKGNYKGQKFTYEARIDVSALERVSIQTHLSSFLKWVFKNRHTPMVKNYGYILLAKKQVKILKAMKEAA